MARRRMMRATRRSKDLVWITTIVDASILESTPTDIAQIVVSADWSNGNVGFDRCTLMSVRGWLAAVQQGSATAAESTGAYLAMYVTDGSVALNSMDPSVATEYVQFDVLHTTGMSLGAAASSATQAIWGHQNQIEVKTRRKLTTASEVRFAAVVAGADTGTPRVNFNGCIRALLRLDPPS